jgi:2-polyprenyl-3-methyl-5-hydroxy-6-metoxy-1,4-benzoquinol methylase
MSPDEEKEFYEREYRFKYEIYTAEELWDKYIQETKQRVVRFISLYTKKTRLLEIGCASGFFLSEVKSNVGSVMGVELTKDYIIYGRDKGLEIRETLEEIPDNAYDLIFMFHVLEHITDPIDYLQQLKQKLSPNGKLIIEVPNVDDILISIYKIKNHLDFYWEIAHNFYFSKETLGKVLEKSGYIYNIFPHQRYDLSNHIYWMLYGEPGGKGFFNQIFSIDLLEEYEKCLKSQFLCDTIYAIAQKSNENS